MNGHRKFIVVFLCMLISLTAGVRRVYADGPEAGPIVVNADGTSITDVHGDIESTDGPGLVISADHSGNVNITTGGIDAKDDAVVTGTIKEGKIEDKQITGGSTVTVKTGNLTSEESGMDIWVEDSTSESGSSMSVESGNITAGKNGIEAYVYGSKGAFHADVGKIESYDDGIYVYQDLGSTVSIKSEDVTAKSNSSRGVNLDVTGGSNTLLTVDGAISAKAYGVFALSTGNGDHVSVEVLGAVSSDHDGVALTSTANNSSIISHVAGAIDAKNDGMYAYAENGGSVSVEVEGEIKAINKEDGAGVGAKLFGEGIGYVQLTADSVYGKKTGIAVSNSNQSQAYAYVMGTIEGEYVSIAVDKDETQNNDAAQIVAWGITPNQRGNIAEYFEFINYAQISYKDEKAEEFEKNNIGYFLKLEQPKNGIMSVTDEDGKELDYYEVKTSDNKTERIPYAKQDQKVLVKITPDDGYVVKGVYNGESQKVELLVDGNGNYYVMVPKGGRVYLSAELVAPYGIIDETKEDHVIGGGKDHFIEINADPEKFVSVWVDDTDATRQAVVTEGSTIVTLPSSFLDTLSIGEHRLLVRFVDAQDILSSFRVVEEHSDGSEESDTSGHRIPKTGVEGFAHIHHSYKGYEVAAFALATAVVALKKKTNGK